MNARGIRVFNDYNLDAFTIALQTAVAFWYHIEIRRDK